MSDVFISYARSTEADAKQVANALRASGYAVWIDDQLPAHRTYGDVIEERLAAAKAVLVIWSVDAARSEWVRAEADAAREQHKLVQLTIDGAKLPMPFNQIQCADLQGWTGDLTTPGWRKVVDSIGELVGVSVATGSVPAVTASALPAPTLKGRPRWLIASAAAAVAVLVAGFLFVAQLRTNSTAGGATSSTAAEAANDSSKARASSLPFSGRPAIAVLPLENLSSDPQQAYFADGLVEDLISRLSAWRTFPVIDRGSSFRYRGSVDLKRVATELGVRYVVRGSVRREGARIRVTAQLVDASTGATVWNQTFDRNMTDLFAMQDEISATIAASLVDDLDRAEAQRTQLRGTANLDAWGLYQLGLQHMNRFAHADLNRARSLFERATAMDPGFARAHAQLATALLWSY